MILELSLETFQQKEWEEHSRYREWGGRRGVNFNSQILSVSKWSERHHFVPCGIQEAELFL